MRRILGGISGIFGVLTLLFALTVTHLPAPSAMGEREEQVRGVWVGIGATAKRLAVFYPSFLDFLRSDKTIHVAIYILPGFFCTAALVLFGVRRAAVGVFSVLAVWALLDEGSQHLLGRDGEWGDVVANVVGAAVGIVGACVLRGGWRRLRG